MLGQPAHSSGNGVSQLGHSRGAIAGKIGHRDIGLAERDPTVRSQAVVRDSAVPLPGIGEIRKVPTGRPPRMAAALRASPALTPENPQRVPVPRFPGPWLTTTSSASSASEPPGGRSGGSPPQDHHRRPVPLSPFRQQPLARSSATDREKASGSALDHS